MLEKVESVTPLRRNSYALWSVPAYTNSKPELATGDKIQSTKQRILDGDILLCKINPRINRVWVVDTGNLDTSSPIASLEWIIFRTSGKSMDRQFLVDFLSSPKFKNFLLSETIGVTGSQKRVQRNSVKEFMFHLPSLAEQSRIGELFKTLDDLIAATERKKELLQKKKQAYLQLIFSQHLRFKGFTKPWEQRKLNDIAYKVTEKNNNFSIRETFTNSAELGIVSQLDFFDRNLSNAENIVNYYIVRAKDFVYNPRISAAAPVGPINCNNLEREGIISPLYTVFRTHCIDTNYLEWFFKSSDWHKFMRYYGDSGARSDRFSIKDSLFFEMPIPYPVIEEQRKIGEFFKALDDLIAAIDKKINLLKRRKKAYLQLMFI